jgi:hypothetical protein
MTTISIKTPAQIRQCVRRVGNTQKRGARVGARAGVAAQFFEFYFRRRASTERKEKGRNGKTAGPSLVGSDLRLGLQTQGFI